MKKFALFTAAIGLMLMISACGRFLCDFGEGWGPMMNFGYGGMGGMFMGMIFLIVLVAAAIWWVTRCAGSRDDGRLPAGETPLDILKKRYARGEITKELFESMKKDLDA